VCRALKSLQQLLNIVVRQATRQAQFPGSNDKGFSRRPLSYHQPKAQKVVHDLLKGGGGAPGFFFKEPGHVIIERKRGTHIKMLVCTHHDVKSRIFYSAIRETSNTTRRDAARAAFCIQMESQGDSPMDPEITDQIFDELFPVFQRLETQNAAILQLLRDKGIIGDDELAPYLEEAGKSSSVRWQVARIRVAKLLGAAEKKAEMEAAKGARASADTTASERAAKPANRTSKETSGDSAENKRPENNTEESNHARGDDRRSTEKEKEKEKDRDLDAKSKDNQATEKDKTKQDKTTPETAGEDGAEPDHAPRKASQQREDGRDDSSQGENQRSEAKSNKPESRTQTAPEANSSAKPGITREPKSA